LQNWNAPLKKFNLFCNAPEDGFTGIIRPHWLLHH
jgi:hypothetical protein